MASSVKFVQLVGTLDHRRSQEIQQQLQILGLEAGDTVVLNLQGVAHMNSSGVGVLVVLLKQLQGDRIQLYLSRPSASVMLALQISGMMNTFSMYGPDRDLDTPPLPSRQMVVR